MNPKKDSYVPAIEVSEELAEEAKHACARLSVDPPEIKREWWRDLIKIGRSGENLVRPVRLVTSELVAALAESRSPDDIERLFPRPSPRFRTIRMTATIAAAAAVAMAAFVVGGMFPVRHWNGVARLAAVSPTPTQPPQIAANTPAVSQVVPIALPVIAASAPSTAATAPSTAAPAPSTAAPALSTAAPALSTAAPALNTAAPALNTAAPALSTAAPAPSALAPGAPPHILVKRPETEPLMKTRHIPLIAKESKIEAVQQATAPWDEREKTIDRQLNNIGKRIATSSEGRKRTLAERQSVLERRRDYVRRSRKHYKDEARLAWDKAHGAPTLWDHLLANVGF
jgi:hypothetical protein